MVKLDVKLSKSSIDKAISRIDAYQDSLESKIEQYLSRLADVGIQAVNATLGTITEEDLGGVGANKGEQTSNSIVIILGGENALFVEFGAGVTYSDPQHPKAGELGYGVGTYPNQTHAFDPKGWWYTSSTGGSKHSYGNRVYMPLYSAGDDIRQQAVSIAREVFGS